MDDLFLFDAEWAQSWIIVQINGTEQGVLALNHHHRSGSTSKNDRNQRDCQQPNQNCTKKDPNAQHVCNSEPNREQACNTPTLTSCRMHAMKYSHFALAFVSSIPIIILIYSQLLELLHGNIFICIFCIHPSAVEDDYDDVISVINVFHVEKNRRVSVFDSSNFMRVHGIALFSAFDFSKQQKHASH